LAARAQQELAELAAQLQLEVLLLIKSELLIEVMEQVVDWQSGLVKMEVQV
jgi:hypothetical protein